MGADLNMDCVWLDMLSDTPIIDFSSEVSRVGTFIMLSTMNPYDISPPVDWFMEYGVPVWYEWSVARSTSSLSFRFGYGS